MLHRSRFGVALAIVLVVVTACSGTSTSPSSAPATTSTTSTPSAAAASNEPAGWHHGTTIDALRAKGTIVIGVSDDPPWSYPSESGNAGQGVVPGVIQEFMKREGIGKFETVTLVLANYLGAIDSNRIDILGDTLYKNAKRQAVVDYSQPIWYNPDALIVGAGNPHNLHQQSDFANGVKICASEGSNQIDQMKKLQDAGQKFEISPLPDNTSCINAVVAGQVDGALIDAVLSTKAKAENPSLTYDVVADYVPPNLQQVIAYTIFKKGATDLIEAWNFDFDEMSKDGTIDKLMQAQGLDPSLFVINQNDPLFKPR